jgi:hypothetical protein
MLADAGLHSPVTALEVAIARARLALAAGANVALEPRLRCVLGPLLSTGDERDDAISWRAGQRSGARDDASP